MEVIKYSDGTDSRDYHEDTKMDKNYDHVANEKAQTADRIVARLTTELWMVCPKISDSKMESLEKRFKAIIRRSL